MLEIHFIFINWQAHNTTINYSRLHVRLNIAFFREPFVDLSLKDPQSRKQLSAALNFHMKGKILARSASVRFEILNRIIHATYNVQTHVQSTVQGFADFLH